MNFKTKTAGDATKGRVAAWFRVEVEGPVGAPSTIPGPAGTDGIMAEPTADGIWARKKVGSTFTWVLVVPASGGTFTGDITVTDIIKS